jgi:hypothetical protein
MRARLAVCSLVTLVAVAAATRARGDERQYTPPTAPPADPPRWRLRAMLVQGFGGGRDVDAYVARFPTTLELGARVWGPLSLAAGVTATVAGEYDVACGQGVRPSAVAGDVGVRADLANGRSAAWVDPWVEVHGGVGTQAGARPLPGRCPVAEVFGTAGARAGFDAWLGRGAVTVAVAFDYLPVGSALSFILGGTVVVF